MLQKSHFCVYVPRIWKQDLNEIFPTDIHRSIIHNRQDIETTEVSISGYMDKQSTHTHMHTQEYYAVSTRKKILSYAATWVYP